MVPPDETEKELVEDAAESGLALEGGVKFVS